MFVEAIAKWYNQVSNVADWGERNGVNTVSGMRSFRIHPSKELSELRLSFYGNPAGAADYSGTAPGTGAGIRDWILGRGRGSDHRNYPRILALNGLLLIAVLVLYTFNQMWLKGETAHWFVHGYLNDILAGIWLPALINALASVLRVRLALVKDPATIVLIVVTAGLFWELAAPLFVIGSTQDPMDILAYVTGAILYIGIVRLVQKGCGQIIVE